MKGKTLPLGEVVAEISNGRVELDLPFRLKDIAKDVPGLRWDSKGKVWHAPLSWATCKALRGVFGDDLQIGENLNNWAGEEIARRVAPAMHARGQLDVELSPQDDPRLFPFQRAGIAFLEAAGSAVLADDMGLGKTIQLLRTVERNIAREGHKPVLIVCPNSVKHNWPREAQEWTNLRLAALHGSITQKRKTIELVESGDLDGVVVNWESLARLSRLAPYGSVAMRKCEDCGGAPAARKVSSTACHTHMKPLNFVEWGHVVADEAHKAKDPKAQQTRAWWYLAQRADHSYAATGTPIANAPDDFWAIMHGVAKDEFPTKTKYIDRFCRTSFNPFGGLNVNGLKPETKDEFFSVVDPRFIRRPKEAVLPQLPEKTHTIRRVDLTGKQKKAYKQLSERMMVALDNGGAVAANPLVQAGMLSRLASAYGEVEYGPDGETRITLIDPSSKLDEFEAILTELGAQQVVVFAESRQLIELLAKRLEKRGTTFGLVTGRVHEIERQSNVDRFQRGELQVIALTLGAGGTGITLTSASTLVFLQRSWSNVENKQATDRVHRIGQENHVNIVDIVANDTIEDVRLARLGMKEERLQELTRDQDAIRELLGKTPK